MKLSRLDLSHRLLTAEEERELIARINSSDPDDSAKATRELAECNLRLVLSIAKKFVRGGADITELIHEGTIGLMHAVERFDLSRNVRFSTYAAYWIRLEIINSFQRRPLIRIPKGISDYIYGSEATRAKRDAVEVSSRKNAAHAKSIKVTYESQTEADGQRSIFAGLIGSKSDPVDLDAEAERADLERALKVLSDRERRVIFGRYGLDGDRPKTLKSIAESLGVSKERARQIQAQAIEKLRKQMCA